MSGLLEESQGNSLVEWRDKQFSIYIYTNPNPYLLSLFTGCKEPETLLIIDVPGFMHTQILDQWLITEVISSKILAL